MPGEADTFLLLVVGFLLPPAAVAFVSGCGGDLCLNILLTMLGWFPGCIHAYWLIFRRAEANERYGYKNWRYNGMGEYVGPRGAVVTPTYGATEQGAPPPPAGQAPPPPPAPAPAPGPGPAPAPAYPLPPPAPQPEPAPAEQKYQAPPLPLAPSSDQKATQVASTQSAPDQKLADPAPQYTATPSGGT